MNEPICNCQSKNDDSSVPSELSSPTGKKLQKRLLELYWVYEYGIKRADKKIKRLMIKTDQLAERITLLESNTAPVEMNRSKNQREEKFVPYEKMEEMENDYKANLKEVIDQHCRTVEQIKAEHKQFYIEVVEVNNRLLFEKDSENSKLRNILSEQSTRLQSLEDVAKRKTENCTNEKCASTVEELKNAKKEIAKLKDANKILEQNNKNFDLTTVKKIQVSGLNMKLVECGSEIILSVSNEISALGVLEDLKDLKQKYREIEIQLNIPKKV